MNLTPGLRAMESRTPSFEHEEDDTRSFAPAQRLLTAILLRAVRDYVTYKDSPEGTLPYEIAVDAEEWLFHGDDCELSFLDICTQIGVSPEKIRSSTRALTRDDLIRLNPPSDVEET